MPLLLASVPQIRLIQLRVKFDNYFILRTLDFDDMPILIDIEILSLGQLRALFPFAGDALLPRAAVDRVHDDPPIDRLFTRLVIVNGSLRKRLVTGNENGFVRVLG